MKWKHWFIPHPETHKKAHLINAEALLIYILLFIFIQTGLSVLGNFKPGVLGINSSVDQKRVIDLTNSERQKNNLAALSENEELDKAALAKAQNMFAENYWAHYSPSGKDPWGFINGAGYKFSYAGENLARNFYKSEDVVDAWMASPSHRANIVNSHYQDIGIAVLEGTLQGQKTTLVVQEFGSPVEALAQAPKPEIQAPAVSLPNAQPSAQAVQVANNGPVAGTVALASQQQTKGWTWDPYVISKSLGGGVVLLVMVLTAIDIYIIRRRAIQRIASHNLPHLALLSISATALFTMTPGNILPVGLSIVAP